MHSAIFNEQEFTIVYASTQATKLVEVHVTDMDGWLLYECFVLPSYDIHWFSWDQGADTPEWIDMENEELNEELSILCSELSKYKQVAA